MKEFEIGSEVKEFVSTLNTQIQDNKISEETVKMAVCEMFKYMKVENITFDIDNFGQTNLMIFEKQEERYSKTKKYNLLSLLSVALIDIGIIEIEED